MQYRNIDPFTPQKPQQLYFEQLNLYLNDHGNVHKNSTPSSQILSAHSGV